jgi:hypothetical protein
MSLRFQGLAFSALAWLLLLASLWLPRLDAQVQLAVLAPVILLLGVPHGALDVVFVRQLTRIQSAAGWSLFTIAYLAVAALVVLLWWVAPAIFQAILMARPRRRFECSMAAPSSFAPSHCMGRRSPSCLQL